MKTIRNEADRADLIDRLSKLSGSEKAAWGKMNINQMLSHLVQSCDMPFKEMVPDASNILSRNIAKYLVLYVLPIPKGVKTTPEINQQENGRKPQDFAADKKLVVDSLENIASVPENYACVNHPFFGKMTAKEWAVMVYKHTDHHLKQFGV